MTVYLNRIWLAGSIMTYILGLKQPGINAIIADCRETLLCDGEGRNDVLKVGQLFPGCIFGRAGSVQSSRDFINAFIQSVDEKTDTPEGFWNRFERFVNSYNFPLGKDNQFRLLLSVRVLRVPLFFEFDSAKGISQPIETSAENFLISWGSGKDALHSIVCETFVPRLKSHLDYLLTNKHVKDIKSARLVAPYFFCLWLSELTLTFEKSWLENPRIGVGGPFYFMFQTFDGEIAQQPAVYIFSIQDRETKAISSWIHRVVPLSNGLYLETGIPPHQDLRQPEGKIEEVYLDLDSGLDDIRDKTLLFENEVRQQLASRKYFYFCGFGSSPPSDRNAYGYIASSSGDRNELFDQNGAFTPDIHNLIVKSFNFNNKEQFSLAGQR